MTSKPTLAELRPKDFTDTDSWRLASLSDCGFDDFEQKPDQSIFVRSDGAGLIYPYRTHTLYAPSETGKSWVALLAARDAARVNRNSLLIDFEGAGADENAFRLRALGLDDDQVASVKYMAPKGPPNRIIWAETLDVMNETKIEVVIIDAVSGGLAQAGRNSTNEDYLIWEKAFVAPITDRAFASVILVDHAPLQDKVGRGPGPIGTQAKRASLTGASFRLKAVRPLRPGEIGVIDLFVDKDRPGRVREQSGPQQNDGTQHAARITIDASDPSKITAVIDPPPIEVVQETQAKTVRRELFTARRADEVKQRISVIIEQSAEPMTTNAIRLGLGSNRNKAGEWIKELARDGYLTSTPGPGTSVLYASLRPFRTDTGGG